MNFSTFVYDERQRDGNCDRENLCDLPLRIVGAVSIRLVDGVGIDLRAAGRLGEPAEEFGVLARRLGGENERFTVGLLCFLCCAVTEIPCDRVAICGELRIKRLCCCDGHGIVQTATRSGGVPALERMTGLDRRARRGGCRRIRLACRGDAGFAINGAAVRSGVPLDRQADSCTAIVALAVTVRVGVVSVFIARIAAGRARLGALMLRFAVRHPRTIGIAVVGIVISGRAAAGAGFRATMLRIGIFTPRTGCVAVISIIGCGISAGATGCRSAMLAVRIIAPRSVAHTVAGIIIVRRAAVPAIGFAPVLRG